MSEGNGTVVGMRPLVGRIGLLTCGTLEVRVRIVDARKAWNRTDALVRPQDGAGEQWVDASRIRLDPEAA